jgi:superfamily I DNA and RNA helicase
VLDLVIGKKQNPQAVEAVITALRQQPWHGTLYIGYPIFAGEEGSTLTDALLTCKEHGVVVFDLSPLPVDGAAIPELAEMLELRQNDLYRGLHNRLFTYRELTRNKGRELAVQINVITLIPEEVPGLPDQLSLSTPDSLLADIQNLPPIPEELFKPLNAAIQKTAALKPRKKRLAVKRVDSMGGVIKRIEAEIANLDKWQKSAAIECPDNPQRIRGLAGSGKTIILAMKAAYLHANFPEQNIAVTFHTRSLYQQFQSLISKFYYDQVQDDPDWDKLKILHAWGSASSPGVYSAIAGHAAVAAMDFGQARFRFGYADAFRGVCQELLKQLQERKIEPLWDFLLIDEAQDFPPEFFKLAYRAVRPPKRIVWAYDELQNLGDYQMPPVSELFGVDEHGAPLVSIVNHEGLPKQDILLPVCYRNPPWTLSLALALGLGVYRDQGPVQMFDEPAVWREIGFERVNGDLALGSPVTLKRREDRSPGFFSELLTPERSISFSRFASEEEQAEWIAASIVDAVKAQELEPSDILVVIPEAITAPKKAAPVMRALEKAGISSHITGVTASRDVIFVDDSVAISGIFRAKGNEAPLVFLANAEYCYSGSELSKRRNILFTAITRSKAWVRLCGVGRPMDGLIAEINEVIRNRFQLSFRYPTEPQIATMRRTYREKTEAEKKAEKKEIESLRRLLEKLDSGEVLFDELPHDLAEKLRGLGAQ